MLGSLFHAPLLSFDYYFDHPKYHLWLILHFSNKAITKKRMKMCPIYDVEFLDFFIDSCLFTWFAYVSLGSLMVAVLDNPSFFGSIFIILLHIST